MTGNFGDGLILTYVALTMGGASAFGLLSTVPVAFGALSQAVVPKLCQNVPRKNLVVLSVLAQTTGLALAALAAAFSGGAVLPLGLALLIYYLGTAVTVPAWQDWVSELVGVQRQNRFFAKRAARLNLVTIASLLASGYLLGDHPSAKYVALLLSVGVGARALSLILFLLHPPCPERISHRSFPLHPAPPAKEYATAEATAAAGAGPGAAQVSLPWMCFWACAFRFGVNVAGPHMTPYMFRELGMSVSLFTWINVVSLVARLLLTANVARLLDERRVYEGMVLSSIMIALMPPLWALFHGTCSLVIWQVFGGLAWGAFDLLNILLVQRLFPRSVMTSLGAYLCANALGGAAGALLGGVILDTHLLSYGGLFALSGALRFTAAFGLLSHLRARGSFRFRQLRLGDGFSLMVTGRCADRVRPPRLVTRLAAGRSPSKFSIASRREAG